MDRLLGYSYYSLPDNPAHFDVHFPITPAELAPRVQEVTNVAPAQKVLPTFFSRSALPSYHTSCVCSTTSCFLVYFMELHVILLPKLHKDLCDPYYCVSLMSPIPKPFKNPSPADSSDTLIIINTNITTSLCYALKSTYLLTYYHGYLYPSW